MLHIFLSSTTVWLRDFFFFTKLIRRRVGEEGMLGDTRSGY